MKRKTLTAVLLALILVLQCVPALAAGQNGETPYPEATYALTYAELPNGGLIITGFTGRASGELRIPAAIGGKPVVGVYDNAFYNGSGFTGPLVLPDTLLVVGEFAFYGCSGLTGELVLPDAFVTVGKCGFALCKGLTGKLTVGKDAKELGPSAFMDCGFTDVWFRGNAPKVTPCSSSYSTFDKSGVTLHIQAGTTGWMDPAVYDSAANTWNGYPLYAELQTWKPSPEAAFSLTYLILPDDTIRIAGFEGEAAGPLVLPEQVDGRPVTIIGKSAFYGCSKLTGTLTLPDTVTTIGADAFGGCSGFTGPLVLPEGLQSLGRGAFARCVNLSGDLKIPAGVKKIETNAFFNCYDLEGTLSLPEGLRDIGYYAFSSCGFTGDLVIPEGVESLQEGAFFNCSGLTGTIRLPATLQGIGSAALTGIGGTGFLVAAGNSYFSAVDGVLYDAAQTRTVVCPVGKTGELHLPATLKYISADTFERCTLLTGPLHLPDGLLEIENDAFCYDKGFTGKLIIPDSVQKIGEYAFGGCRGLTGWVTIGTGTDSIARYAFRACSSVEGFLFRGNAPSSCTDVSFDRNLKLYYVPGTTGWTDSPSYNAAQGTWKTHPLATWDPEGEAHVQLTGVTWEQGTETVTLPPLPDTVQVVLAVYAEGRLQKLETVTGSYDGVQWTVPDGTHYDEVRVFAMNADRLPLCAGWSVQK